jgi:hypothetical protein
MVHYGHLPEAVSLRQELEKVILSLPGFQDGDFAPLYNEH